MQPRLFREASSFHQDMCSWFDKLQMNTTVLGMFEDASSCQTQGGPPIILPFLYQVIILNIKHRYSKECCFLSLTLANYRCVGVSYVSGWVLCLESVLVFVAVHLYSSEPVLRECLCS
jgi:hypothetical protein